MYTQVPTPVCPAIVSHASAAARAKAPLTRMRCALQTISHLYDVLSTYAFSRVLQDQTGNSSFSRRLSLTAIQLYGADGACAHQGGKTGGGALHHAL